MPESIHYWYSLSWDDEQGRMWVYPPMTFESSSDARKAHGLSLRGSWVKSDMKRAHVSDLYVNNGTRLTTIADGGFVSQPPTDKRLPYKD